MILGLAFHLAAVGMIGLSVIILATTFTGVTDEHAIGKAFQESLPFTCIISRIFLCRCGDYRSKTFCTNYSLLY